MDPCEGMPAYVCRFFVRIVLLFRRSERPSLRADTTKSEGKPTANAAAARTQISRDNFNKKTKKHGQGFEWGTTTQGGV